MLLKANHIKQTPLKRHKGLSLSSIIVATIFLIVGIIFGTIGFSQVLINTEITKGIVIDVDEKYDSEDNEYNYKATVEYKVHGKKYTSSTLYSSNNDYYEGEKVTVNYSPKNPKKMYLNDYNDRTMFGIVFIIVAISFSIIPIIVFIKVILFIIKYIIIKLFFH